jgi:deoxyribodipyrimidine photolyase-related protein
VTPWHFIDRNAGTLSKNHRLAQIFSSWQRMDPDKEQSFRDSASALLQKLDDGERI